MSDDVDRAQQESELALSLALRQHKQAQQHETQCCVDGHVLCIDCESVIPEQRLRLIKHAVRCVDCQQLFEQESVCQ